MARKTSRCSPACANTSWNYIPTFERLDAPFEIQPGVVIPAGSYRTTRFRTEVNTATKRPWVVDFAFRWGGFYRGSLRQYQPVLTLKPSIHASLQKVAVVDANRSAVTATWPVTAGAANFPMALDPAHQRLFVLTRRPPHLVVLDTATGKAVATLPADGDADDLFYDAARQRLYGCFGAGSVVVYTESDPDHYTELARVPTAAGARTGLFSPDLRRLFVAVPHRANPSAEIRVFDTGTE